MIVLLDRGIDVLDFRPLRECRQGVDKSRIGVGRDRIGLGLPMVDRIANESHALRRGQQRVVDPTDDAVFLADIVVQRERH